MVEDNKNLEQEGKKEEEKAISEEPSLASITAGASEENLMELGVESFENQPTSTTNPEKIDVVVPATESQEKEIALLNMAEKLDRLEKHFEEKLKYDQHKEQTIDKLHHELQKYKDDLIGKLLKPVFMDIIEVIDDLHKMIRSMAQKGALNNPEKLFKVLKEIPEDLEDKLYRHGVEVLELDSSEFNPTYQKVLKVLPSTDANLDKTVHEKVKNGYRLDGKLIRHQMVTVYKYKKDEILLDKETEAKK